MFHYRRTIFIPIIFGLLVVFAAWRASAASNQLQVTYLDVGQGDCALLRGPDGFDVLIDGGDTFAGQAVVAYLRQVGVDDIDVLLASHGDQDHIGGLIDVLAMNDIPVEQVLYNGYRNDTQTWYTFETAVANEGLSLVPAQATQSLTWGQMQAYVLNPMPGLVNPETNAASLVVLVTYGGQRFLFTGDIDSAVENGVLARYTPQPVDVLKVAHHGSDSSSSDKFLATVQPAEAVISVGQNSFGHPGADALARLSAIGARIWRTDLHSSIFVDSDGVSYTIVSLRDEFQLLPLIHRQAPVQPHPSQVHITNIFYDGTGSKEPDEYVELRNDGAASVQLDGWTLSDEDNRVFTFPPFLIDPGVVCRVYTNEDHAQWCGFNWGSGSPIWDNSGECASLRDQAGAPVDESCY